ncbi:hypothetical protein ACLBVW_22205, partial [Pseudomonas aeruginosa]|uniref:hypothetical protein n=1 Tax=Pseudomonas aeruginosa TaxID=287 RepID=UPI00396A1D50
MLLNLFNEMRAAKVPVSVRELLDLIDALKHRVVFADIWAVTGRLRKLARIL